MEFRNLKAEEIELFPKVVKKNSCMLLLYKDARCDMAVLDESVGHLNWQRHHKRDNANCVVSIWDKEKEQWVSKEDTGVESFSEKEKGIASDSFKRACFNWGIGRELYTAPSIWIKLHNNEIDNYKGRYKVNKFVKFEVSNIKIEDGKIVKLKIIDQNNKVRFKWQKGGKKPDTKNYKTLLNKKMHDLGLNKKEIIDIIKNEFGKTKINNKEAEKLYNKLNKEYVETAKKEIIENIKKMRENYNKKEEE